MRLFINDGRFQPGNVTLLSDFRARKAGVIATRSLRAATPPAPVPDDGEDDEIPNEPKER